ncbi:MAG: DsbA family protein, partial [Martelella sp.]
SPEDVFADPAAPVLGNPEGDVTVVEYFDFQCTYCKRDYPMIRDVVAEDGNVKLVMKDWPIFGPVSVYAAQAVQGAAALGDYETALDALMRANTRLSHEKVEEILTDAGLDFDAIAASVTKNQDAIAALLDRNYHQAEAFQFNGTPSFVIGRTVYPGVLDRALLEEAIAKARAA